MAKRKTTKTRRKKKYQKKKNSAVLLFTLFITIALLSVVLLEYIDFRKGKKSFIFTKIIRLENLPKKVKQFNGNFLRILDKNDIGCHYFEDDSGIFHFELDIESKRFQGLVDKMKGEMETLSGKVNLAEIQGLDGKSMMLYEGYLESKLTHKILITKFHPAGSGQGRVTETVKAKPPEKEPVPAKPSREKEIKNLQGETPKIAFIIDDIGAYDIGALELKRLNIPITASILPDSPNGGEEAAWADKYGLHTMLHIPMQPKNGNTTYNRKKTITLKSTNEEITQLIRRAKKLIPNARGLNNHQGSLATSNTELMTRTLKIIKAEGLFFVDSRTIGSTVAYSIARKMGISTANKSVFLDHVNTYSHSISQIRRMVEIALKNGKAIAIGHPHKTTLRAIRNSLKYIQSRGVKIVYVSQLLD